LRCLVNGVRHPQQLEDLFVGQRYPLTISPLRQVHEQRVDVQMRVRRSVFRGSGRFVAKLGDDEIARMLHPRLAVLFPAAHGQVLLDIGQRRSHGIIIGLDQALVAPDQGLQRDAFGRTEGQVQRRAGLGVLAHGLTGRDAMAKITLQHGFEAGGVDGTDCAQAPGTFTLPGRGAAVAAVVVVGLVGIIVGGEGRTGPIDLAVRDHGCSGK